jgi:hypothetical protein
MAGQITLYKDEQRSQPLTDGSWLTTVDLGTAVIPALNNAPQPGVLCYGKNTGTTTIQAIAVTPIAGGGSGGAQLASDTDIAVDASGTPGQYGIDGAQVTVMSGSLGPALTIPQSNNSTNITNPSTQPTISVGTMSSTLSGGAYTVAYSFTNSFGETMVSPSATLTITAGQTVRVSAIALGANATGVKFYMSYRPNDTTLFYSAQNGGSAQIELFGAQGFFQFWVRQTLRPSDTPGIKQARLQIDAIDIG